MYKLALRVSYIQFREDFWTSMTMFLLTYMYTYCLDQTQPCCTYTHRVITASMTNHHSKLNLLRINYAPTENKDWSSYQGCSQLYSPVIWQSDFYWASHCKTTLIWPKSLATMCCIAIVHTPTAVVGILKLLTVHRLHWVFSINSLPVVISCSLTVMNPQSMMPVGTQVSQSSFTLREAIKLLSYFHFLTHGLYIFSVTLTWSYYGVISLSVVDRWQ